MIWMIQTWSGQNEDGNENYMLVEGGTPEEALLEAQAEGLLHVSGGMHITISPTEGAVTLQVDEFWAYTTNSPEIPSGIWVDLLGEPQGAS